MLCSRCEELALYPSTYSGTLECARDTKRRCQVPPAHVHAVPCSGPVRLAVDKMTTQPAPGGSLKSPKKPTLVSQFTPEIYLTIFGYLPVASLASIALCCRRFKVLSYNDAIYRYKLASIREDAAAVPATGSGMTGSPPLTTASSQSGRAPTPSTRPTNMYRNRFIQVYNALAPYYVDFRLRRRDAKVFRQHGSDPVKLASILLRLVNFGHGRLFIDYKMASLLLTEITISCILATFANHYYDLD